LNIGWSSQSGLTVGISAGVGIENIFSVGIGINYGFKSGNFSATLNASAFGGYISGGYDTKAGWMVGAGYAAPSAFSAWSPVSFSTNILSVGVDYSENGGWSGNYSALSISSSGMSLNPSVGASLLLYESNTSVTTYGDNKGITNKENATIATEEQKNEFLKKYHVNLKSKGVDGVGIEGKIEYVASDGTIYYRRENGILVQKSPNGTQQEIGGFTIHKSGWFGSRSSSVYVSPTNSEFIFAVLLNHEFIHAYHYLIFGNMPGLNKFSENSAYTNSHEYIRSIQIPVNDGNFNPGNGNLYWPKDLIPIEH